MRDYSKCILCYKCVEACGEEAQNTFAIAVGGRGFEAGITTERLDVMDRATIDDAAARHGALDVLLNGAGFVHHGTVLQAEDDDLTFSFELNVRSMHRTIRAFLPAR